MTVSAPFVELPALGLRLRARHASARSPELLDDRVVLDAEPAWFLEGAVADVRAAASALGPFCESIRDDLLEVRFGNAVGVFRIGDDTIIEVRSRKWGRHHFARMLEEVTQTSAALPFAARSGGALPYDRSLAARDDLLYHAFVYVRHILQGEGAPETRLVPAINLILSQPHQRWTRITRPVRPELVRSIGLSGLTRMLTGQHPLDRVGHTDIALARRLNGHMPRRIEDQRLESSLDTPENRFVKTFLDQVSGVVKRMARHLEDGAGGPRQSAFTTGLLRDCDEMRHVLDRIERTGRWLWDQLGPMVHVPMASTVLQRQRGYREVFAQFARLRMASRLPLSPTDARQLMEVKDIALLYELWTYFQLVEAVTDVLGAPTRAIETQASDGMESAVRHGMTVHWANGVRAAYNPSFGWSGRKGRRSYSVGLRPDVALIVPRGGEQELHLFDAKFRLDRLRDVMPLREFEGEDGQLDEEERAGTFKRADLYKMHTYRDAIVGSRSVWIMYPGHETRFFAVDREATGDGVPADRANIDGVGALPVRPEVDGTVGLGELVRHLLTG